MPLDSGSQLTESGAQVQDKTTAEHLYRSIDVSKPLRTIELT